MNKNGQDLILLLHRHPSVDVPRGICYGASNVPLRPSAMKEWETNLLRLHKESVQHPVFARQSFRIITSPLDRCLEPAKTLNLMFPGARFEIQDGFREIDFGVWEMVPWDDLYSQGSEAFRRWSKDWVEERAPEGESYLDLSKRVHLALDRILKSSSEIPSPGRIDLFTHSGPIRALLSGALDLPLLKSFQLRLDYGSVSALRYREGQLQVEFVNLPVENQKAIDPVL